MNAPSPRSAVLLLSGGLDSAANLAFAREAGERILLALTADYGQRAAAAEVRAARALAAAYGVEHAVVDLTWLGRLGGSALTDASRGELPAYERAELDDARRTRESARAVWVPNRNGVLLQTAAAYAERLGAARVLVGFNREEAATFPDNTGAFLDATSDALGWSTATAVRAASYTTELDKRQTVARLRALREPEFPFGLLWSCYAGAAEPCGRCESCQRLARAKGDA